MKSSEAASARTVKGHPKEQEEVARESEGFVLGRLVPPTSLPAIFADSISGQSPEILGSRDRWAA